MLMATHLIGFGVVSAGDPSAVAGYTIMAPNSGGYGALMVSGWTFAWSDDNSAYTTVDTQSTQTFTDNEKKTYTFTPPADKHRYWRWSFSGGGASNEIGELEILNGSSVDLVPLMTSNTAPSPVVITGSDDAANAYVALDNANTAAGSTWWGALTASPVITVDFGVAT